jgi:hypothetical protein
MADWFSTTGLTITDGETSAQGDINDFLSAVDTAFATAQTAVESNDTDIALRATIASPTFTGTPAAPTAAAGTSSTQIATTAFAAALAFSSALPAQTGSQGKFVTTNGTSASWKSMNGRNLFFGGM